jgi:serine/threonine protein kinase
MCLMGMVQYSTVTWAILLLVANLLYDRHGNVKVCDFGLSLLLEEQRFKREDTLTGYDRQLLGGLGWNSASVVHVLNKHVCIALHCVACCISVQNRSVLCTRDLEREHHLGSLGCLFVCYHTLGNCHLCIGMCMRNQLSHELTVG